MRPSYPSKQKPLCFLQDATQSPCSPEFGVDLQGFGQHLGPHIPHGVPTDVQFGEGGVAAQSVEDDGEVGLKLGVGQ